MRTAYLSGDVLSLAFPALLFAYYLICWILFGNHQKIRDVPPQYQPPDDISPGMARYILTGGSDGTTLAAVLAQLAAKGIVAIDAQKPSYRVRLLKTNDPVLPEEGALLKFMLNAAVPIQAYPLSKLAKSTAMVQTSIQPGNRDSLSTNDETLTSLGSVVINPAVRPQIESMINAIQEAFRKNLAGVYFTWHWGCIGLGLLATFLWAMVTAFLIHSTNGPPVFLTLWLFFFSSVAGLVFSGVVTSRPKRPTMFQRLQLVLIPLFFFVFPGFVIAHLALPTAQYFVLALLLSVLANSTFMAVLRNPTAEGRRVLEGLAGFREFLVRVEQDRLDRVNTPEEKAEILDRFLPYAIALGVREAWGDAMASALSDAIIAR